MNYYKALDNSLHGLSDADIAVGGEGYLPPGSVKITESEAKALQPKPAIADLKTAAIAKVRALRVNVFATLAGIQSQALAKSDTSTALAISGLQDSLKALPDIDLSNCQTQGEIDVAFTSAWVTIAAAAPANVVSAFNEVLS